MSLNVANCPKCGRIYAKNIMELCPNCVKEVEEQYNKCLKYLRDNRKSTIQELSDATEVTIPQITKFIREGRISLAQASNLQYPCELCGAGIVTGTICEGCRSKLAKDVSQMNEDAKRKQDVNRTHLGSAYKIKNDR